MWYFKQFDLNNADNTATGINVKPHNSILHKHFQFDVATANYSAPFV